VSAFRADGTYEFLKSGVDEEMLELRNLDTGKTIVVEYVTRIAFREDGKNDLVFDKIGNERLLSEIHLSNADGYVLLAAGKRPHTHEHVAAKRAAA